MQVIEALFIRVEEPHDYLHIKHEGALNAALPATTATRPLLDPGLGGSRTVVP
jgi:hypothetical protein